MSPASRTAWTSLTRRSTAGADRIELIPASHRPDDRIQGGDSPKSRYAAVEVIDAENLPVQVACRVLGVAEPGLYERRKRAPSERGVRHARC